MQSHVAIATSHATGDKGLGCCSSFFFFSFLALSCIQHENRSWKIAASWPAEQLPYAAAERLIQRPSDSRRLPFIHEGCGSCLILQWSHVPRQESGTHSRTDYTITFPSVCMRRRGCQCHLIVLNNGSHEERWLLQYASNSEQNISPQQTGATCTTNESNTENRIGWYYRKYPTICLMPNTICI